MRGLNFTAGFQFAFGLRFRTLRFCRQIITSFGIGLVWSSFKTARIIMYFGIESRETERLVRNATSQARGNLTTMAQIAQRLPENVQGEFFVDSTCIDCDACRQIAPASF